MQEENLNRWEAFMFISPMIIRVVGSVIGIISVLIGNLTGALIGLMLIVTGFIWSVHKIETYITEKEKDNASHKE